MGPGRNHPWNRDSRQGAVCFRARATAGGRSPRGRDATEAEVATWWNGLSEDHKVRCGVLIYSRETAYHWDWLAAWDDLAPLGQQMRLHMMYDRDRRKRWFPGGAR